LGEEGLKFFSMGKWCLNGHERKWFITSFYIVRAAKEYDGIFDGISDTIKNFSYLFE